MLNLQEDLRQTHLELKNTREEMQASQEKLSSTNEELQSTNEELQTVNHELQSKVTELSQINNDTKNLLESTEIATLFLDNTLRIRRFTAKTVKFKFIVTNTGNTPLADLSLADNLYDLSAAVLVNPLPAGDTFEYVLEGVTVTAGQHRNTATGVSGGVVYNDSNHAHYRSNVAEVSTTVALSRIANGGLTAPLAEVISLFLLISACLVKIR